MSRVPQVQVDPAVEVHERAAPIHLPEAGNAGKHAKSLHLPGRVTLDLVGERRPRPDETHVTFEHVPQLRQLVDAGLAQERAEPGNAGVASDLEDWTLHLIEMFELGFASLGVREHRAELIEPERAAVETAALLDENCRSARGDSHRYCNK